MVMALTRACDYRLLATAAAGRCKLLLGVMKASRGAIMDATSSRESHHGCYIITPSPEEAGAVFTGKLSTGVGVIGGVS
jgi:hypothetical protein